VLHLFEDTQYDHISRGKASMISSNMSMFQFPSPAVWKHSFTAEGSNPNSKFALNDLHVTLALLWIAKIDRSRATGNWNWSASTAIRLYVRSTEGENSKLLSAPSFTGLFGLVPSGSPPASSQLFLCDRCDQNRSGFHSMPLSVILFRADSIANKAIPMHV